MSSHLTRRGLLAAGAGLTASQLLSTAAFGQTPAIPLRITRRVLDIEGRAASVYGLTNAAGGQGLVLDPGQRFSVALSNDTDLTSLIHWHGQIPPQDQDGVPGLPMPALAPGESRNYDFEASSGTHWMHSHIPVQEMAMLAAPLIVRSAQDIAEDRQEVVLFLHDFSFRDPQEILADLSAGMAGHDMSAMQEPSSQTGEGHAGMDMGAMDHSAMDHSAMAGMDPSAMGAMDLNDIEFDAYLANDRTLSDPQIVSVESGGRIRLRVINAASATTFWIDTGLSARAVAVDGQPILPLSASRFGLAMAQRIDIEIDLPGAGAFPILALREGGVERTGLILATRGAQISRLAPTAEQAAPPFDLDLAQEARFQAALPLAQGAADRSHMVMLGGAMMPYVWTIDGQTWDSRRSLSALSGERVHLMFHNMSPMGHPMHLHGHRFQVVNINGRAINGALRDTVYVPPMAQITVALDAGEAARWMLHCHHMPHLASGMMTELVVTA